MNQEVQANSQRNRLFEDMNPGDHLRISGFTKQEVEALFVKWASDFPEYGSRSYYFTDTRSGSTYTTLAMRIDGIEGSDREARISWLNESLIDCARVNEVIIDSAGYDPIKPKGSLRVSKFGWEIEVGESFICCAYPQNLKFFGMSFLRRRGLDRAYKAVRNSAFDKRTLGSVTPGWIVERIR